MKHLRLRLGSDWIDRVRADFLLRRAHRHQVKNEPAAAIDAFERALRIGVPTPSARRKALKALSDLLLAADRRKDALSHLKALVRSNPRNVGLLAQLAAQQQELGNIPGAISSWRKVLTVRPDHVQAHRKLYRLYRKKKNYGQATIHLRALLIQEPRTTAKSIELARLTEKAKDVEGAISAWREVLICPDPPPLAHRHLALLLRKVGREAEAIQHLREVLQAKPDSARLSLRLAEALTSLGKWADALQAWQSVIAMQPDNPRAHTQTGAILMRLGRGSEASLHLKQAALAAPDSPKSWESLARALAASGDAYEAAAAWRRVIAISPHDGEAHEQIGRLLVNLGQKQEALPHFREAIDPPDAGAGPWARYAALLSDLGHDDDALDAWHRADKLGYDQETTQEHIARLYQRKGRVKDALRHRMAAVAIAPRSLRAAIRLAQSLSEFGGTDEVVAAWERVLVLDPAEATAHEHLVAAFLSVGRLSEARRHAVALAQARPEDVDSWRRLSDVLDRLGQDAEALEAWTNVLRLDPSDFKARSRLALILRKFGRSDEAEKYIQILKSAAVSNPRARKYLPYLESGNLTFQAFPDTILHNVPDFYGRSAAKLIDPRSNASFHSIAKADPVRSNTLLYIDRLFTIFESISSIARMVPKTERCVLLEVGVYKGGTSFFMASLVERCLSGRVSQFAVDTFSGHDAGDVTGIVEGSHGLGQFGDTTYSHVRALLSPFPFVTVVKDRIQDVQIDTGQIWFIHLDTDLYSPTCFTLERYGAGMPAGGIIIVDDYGFITCPGVRRAVDEYLAQTSHMAKFELQTGQCLLVRT